MPDTLTADTLAELDTRVQMARDMPVAVGTVAALVAAARERDRYGAALRHIASVTTGSISNEIAREALGLGPRDA